MNDNYANGRITYLIVYLIGTILCLVLGLRDSFLPMWAKAVLCIYLAAAFLVLRVAYSHQLFGYRANVKLQIALFIVLVLIAGSLSRSTEVFFCMLFVLSIAISIYMDIIVYRFFVWCLFVLNIAAGITTYMLTKGSTDPLLYLFEAAALWVTQWMIFNQLQLNEFQQRRDHEQERSLDDLLKVVAAKCDEARRATRSKSNFLSKMSHEIRTPINTVLGMNEMILRESGEQQITEYASHVDSSGRMLLSLVNDILDFSKIESNKMEIVPVEYHISSLIYDLTNMIQIKAQKKDLQFTLNIDGGIPSVLYGDDVRIRQVLINILTNAVKYTDEGGITLTVRRQQDAAADGETELYFEVRDTGIGIREEDIGKLFVAFQRIEEKRNRNIEGTGLGINIVIQLLELMGSSLQVESVYGQGSVFSFVLRQGVVDEEPVGDIQTRFSHIVQEHHYRAQLYAPKASVLVVDDNEMNRMVFKNLLKQTGISVAEAGSGEECLSLVRERHFDIIFLDHMMAGMDGMETLSRMREMPDDENKCNGTPVVALTANAVSGAREKYIESGFNEFLEKPIITDKLEKIIIGLIPEELREERPEDTKRKEVPLDSEKMQETADVSDLPAIDGVDWNYAAIHFTEKELLLDVVREFVKSIGFYADELEQHYRSIGDGEQLNLYRIKVHAMKSSAALVGIVPLSGMAKILENAAADGELEIIESMTPVFLSEWRGYREKLACFVPPQGEKKDVEDMAVILKLLDSLRDASAAMDIDAMDEIMSDLEKYEYDEEAGKIMEQLSVSVTNLDIERIKEYTDKGQQLFQPENNLQMR